MAQRITLDSPVLASIHSGMSTRRAHAYNFGWGGLYELWIRGAVIEYRTNPGYDGWITLAKVNQEGEPPNFGSCEYRLKERARPTLIPSKVDV